MSNYLNEQILFNMDIETLKEYRDNLAYDLGQRAIYLAQVDKVIQIKGN